MMVSLDGYFEGPNHELDWHNVDHEFNEFAITQLENTGILLFGRNTYSLMAGYWPTKLAKKDDPEVAGLMNNMPKIVFSHTLKKAKWQNTRIAGEHIASEVHSLQVAPGKDVGIFGSNALAVSLVEKGILCELRVMVAPVILGRGTIFLNGLHQNLSLSLMATRKFNSGNVLLTYTINR